MTPPDLKLLANPTLLDYLHVCHHLQTDERFQIEATTGSAYIADQFAAFSFAYPGQRWGYYVGEEPLFVGGLIPVRPSVYTSYVLCTARTWDYGAEATAVLKDMLHRMTGPGGPAQRIELVSMASRTRVHSWYELIGMSQEGRMPKWGANGEDAIMFSRVRA